MSTLVIDGVRSWQESVRGFVQSLWLTYRMDRPEGSPRA